MEHEIENISNKLSERKVANWFDDMVSTLRAHELLLITNTAPKKVQSIYKAFITNDENKLHSTARTLSTHYFIKHLLWDFITNLAKSKIPTPNKLALSHNNSSVLVWAEINDNDEEAENTILLTSAKINARYSQQGFHISSTIVEKSDNLPIPPHYVSLLKTKPRGILPGTSKPS